ncbi:MAG: glycosyltransferase [Myxococcota bacterium]
MNRNTLVESLAHFDPEKGSEEAYLALEREFAAIEAAELQGLSTTLPRGYVLGRVLERLGDPDGALTNYGYAFDQARDWRGLIAAAPLLFATRNAAAVANGESALHEALALRPDLLLPGSMLEDRIPLRAFHGDPHYQSIVLEILGHATHFIETGTFLGRSTAFVADRFPSLDVFTTETSETDFALAEKRFDTRDGIQQHRLHTTEFLDTKICPRADEMKLPVFFLNAQREQDWPLTRELELIQRHFRRAVIIIDRFKVPDRPEFAFDDYGGNKVCELARIRPALDESTAFQWLMPKYGIDDMGPETTLTGYAVFFHGCPEVYRSALGTDLVNRRFTTRRERTTVGSPEELAVYAAEGQSPYLVSFPRTGSHWLRMVLELYFDRPMLTRWFFDHASEDFLLNHSHDMDLGLSRENVLYLYRDPVDTIFSQLRYHDEEPTPENVAKWSDLYGKHLHKWLISIPQCLKRFTVLSYERLKSHPRDEFSKAIAHLEEDVDPERLADCIKRIDKAQVSEKTEHNRRVMNRSADYEVTRDAFRETHAEAVWSALLHGRDDLAAYFDRKPVSPIEGLDVRHPKQPWEYKKIVGLVPMRNEADKIEFCLRALAKFTDAIVVFDDDSTDASVDIAHALAEDCNVEAVVRNHNWNYDETHYRQRLLDVGRELGGTHFICIDADEAFTSNLLDNNSLRRELLQLAPGEKLSLAWIQLWRSLTEFRHDDSVWTNNYKVFAFADDGRSNYHDQEFHLLRAPSTLTGKTVHIPGYAYGLLHFQFVNWTNLLIKQAWYRCLERIKQPAKPVEAINALYAPSKDETGLRTQASPYAWFVHYDHLIPETFEIPERWRTAQVREWFNQHGVDHFADLDIWDVDWGIPAPTSHPTNAGSVREIPARPRSPVDDLRARLSKAEKLAASGAIRQAVEAIRDGDGVDVKTKIVGDRLVHRLITARRDRYVPILASDKEPMVSAIVSTYNSERYIRGCLEDLLQQTLGPALEIIVIDSGSEQREGEIVAEYQRHHGNIRYVRTERETVYRAWNRGVELATGRYLTNANTDDRHRVDALELMAHHLETHPEHGLVYADVFITREANQPFDTENISGVYQWQDYSRDRLFEGCFIGPQPMWRAKLHERYGLFDQEMVTSGDYDFWMRISDGTILHHLREFLGLYLKAPDSIEHRNRDRQREENAIIRDRYRPKVARVI